MTPLYFLLWWCALAFGVVGGGWWIWMGMSIAPFIYYGLAGDQ